MVFSFLQDEMCAPEKWGVSVVLRALARPIGIGHASCPDLTAQFQTMTIEFVIFMKSNFS